VFDFEKEIPFAEVPKLNVSRYVPIPPPPPESSSSSSSGEPSISVIELQNIMASQNEMRDLLISMNDKINMLVSKMSNLEMKVQLLQHTVQTKK
jgi:hypothetical protein